MYGMYGPPHPSGSTMTNWCTPRLIPHHSTMPALGSPQDDEYSPPFYPPTEYMTDDNTRPGYPSSSKPVMGESPSADLTPHPTIPPDGIRTPPSLFSDKLYTNYIPDHPEITEIQQYVSAVTTEVSELDQRVAELEAALADVMTRRAHLQEVACAHQALISPLRRLPPELLQYIFVLCLPSNRNAVMHASEAPVLLGRVCSEWRRVSLGTPEVWASLHVVPPNVNFSNPASSTARFQRKRELLEMWLGRSGACPLNISFVWFAGDSEDEMNLCGSLLEVLVPMCGRWRVLDFQVPLKMFKPFTGLTVKDVPMLEGISLMDNRTPLYTDAVDRWPETLDFAESASRLRNFTLTFFSGGIRLPSIPWPQLTTLYLESNIAFFFQDSREMLTTLSECASLVSCTLKFPLSHTATLPTYEKLNIPITLPQLHTLCVDGDQHLHNTFHMSNTLTNLCAPKLRKLEILGRSGRPEGDVAPEPLAAIRMLLERSKCPLERLNVESMTLMPDEFIACLRLVPTLVELVVHNWAVRVHIGPQTTEEEAHPTEEAHEIAENTILKALTLPSGKTNLFGMKHRTANHKEDLNARTVVEVDTSIEHDNKHDNKLPLLQDIDMKAAYAEVGHWSVNGNEKSHAEATSVHIEPPIPEVNGAITKDKGKGKAESLEVDADSCIPAEASLQIPDEPTLEAEYPQELLCPKLQRFDFTLCDASQFILCDFVASRWEFLPPGAARLRSVKCNFTAVEDEGVKTRMQRFRSEGLDAFVTYQIAVMDDLNPSPWTGLEGPA
ncbi:hypothetical protein B0H34DRAFT_754915 [Crassisporium funariophilum]|nr:hypothetical protein B0H34DRAFT_754915 [Crassisporium funariophilum]